VTRLHSILLTAVLVTGVAVGVQAQEPAPAPAAAPAPVAPTKGLIPLEVEVVITRYEGTKKLSSLPYVLALNGGGTEVQLNMGTQVAVPQTGIGPITDGKPNPFMSYNYKDVGTRISARARIVEGGYDLQLNIDDSSVYTSAAPGMAGAQQMPAFRTFSSRNSLLLRDGQTREYTAATDRINGEVVKVSVALRVVK
jgi:hypothetical protein